MCFLLSTGYLSQARLPKPSLPYIRFLFVETLFCHQLPSDSTSRWTPLLRLTNRLNSARSGLAPPSSTSCLAHHLNHSSYECKYHIVFTPKYRKKELFVAIRKPLKDVFHRLARQKECEIVEGL